MPAIQLTKYQQAAAAWKARFDLRRWSRQTGKTFEDAREIVDDSHERRTAWVILSRGERQSKKNIEQCAMHCQAYGAAAQVIEDTWRGEDAEYKSLEINLPNGSRILGLPANPDTARGFSANVALDEFALHKDSRKIFAALFPVITRGYRLKVTSTPFGKQNKFYDLDIAWSKKMDEDDPHYHTSKIDIYDAIAGGLELKDEEGQITTPEQLKEALGDDDAWDQEYMVLYLDEATAFLTYELIAKCEDPEIEAEPVWVGTLLARAAEMHAVYLETKISPPSFEMMDHTWIDGDAFYIGFDVARRRHGSVIWVNRDRQGVQETVAVIRMKNLPFFIQKVVFFSLVGHPQTLALMIRVSGCSWVRKRSRRSAPRSSRSRSTRAIRKRWRPGSSRRWKTVPRAFPPSPTSAIAFTASSDCRRSPGISGSTPMPPIRRAMPTSFGRRPWRSMRSPADRVSLWNSSPPGSGGILLRWTGS